MNSDVEATYIGAATNFKERYRNHTLSFKHQRYQHNTNLSSYVWSLKAENKPFNIQWSIAGKAPSYNPSMKCCKLCLLEKTLIMKSNDQVQLNKRSELMSKYPLKWYKSIFHLTYIFQNDGHFEKNP